MSSIHPRRTPRLLLGLVALVLAGFALAAATSSASDAGFPPGPSLHHQAKQRLVVRGEATVRDTPCDAGICIALADGQFRGAPVGTGAYTGSVTLRIREAFPNGEGGVCAPLDGDIVLGAGTPDRLVLAVFGDSCQDGAGDPTKSSFTGLARFAVKHGTGAYAKAHGYGLATFLEDAADHDRMTLIGHITR